MPLTPALSPFVPHGERGSGLSANQIHSQDAAGDLAAGRARELRGHGQGAGCRPQRDRPARNEPVRRLVDKARQHNCSHPNDYQYKKHLIANADRKEEGSAGPS